jgi:AcrR family transcriptional regulator
MDSEKLPRRERENLLQRQQILAAALDLFSQKGYHSVSMHEIARSADFAIGTLYKFFQNKEDLYGSLVLEICDSYDEAVVRAIEEEDDEVEKLRNYIRTKIESFHKFIPFIRLLLAERTGASYKITSYLNAEIRKRHYASLEKIASIFEVGIKTKRLNKVADSFSLAVSLDSTVDSFLLLWLDAPDRHQDLGLDAILDIFLKSLLVP